jgi:Cd2+/Zn2+-exporting ATPase
MVKKYTVEGLTCTADAATLEQTLSEMDSVSSVSVDACSKTVCIECSNYENVKNRLQENGMSLHEQSPFHSHHPILLIIISTSLFILGLLTMEKFHQYPFSWPEYAIFFLAYVIAGRNVLRKAVTHSIQGHFFDENFLMTVATIGAFLIHQLPEAVGVMLFYAVGEYLEDLSVERSRRSVQSLLELRPDYAHLKVDGEIQDVSPSTVSVGSSVVINPGERIPLDGMILEGESRVDTSALTGESLSRTVAPGAEVLAGMVNKEGVLTVQVTKDFSHSSLTRILELVEHAANRKATPQKFITKFAKVYTPLVVGAALCVALLPPLIFNASFYDWVYRALVLLVISCPCALVISIPLGYFVGIGKASKEGILIKGANFLEALTSVGTVVFDKTGTLTRGVFTVTKIVPMNGFTKDELLRMAALAESHSNHPIARSIIDAYEAAGHTVDENVQIRDYQEITARGIKAVIDGKQVFVGNDRQLHEEMILHDTCHVQGTVAHVTIDNTYAGYIIISDEVKSEAQKTITALQEMGIRVVMFTGDSKDVAECIAHDLGILKFYSELLPEEKVHNLEELEKDVKFDDNEKIAFVGDGINDAPVIARADVGVAMGALGSDAAVETADMVIMTDDLHKVVDAVRLAKKTGRIIWENIILVLGVKGLVIFIGVLGMATMWEAVFADVGVALLAIFNAARIFRT